jgi:hypothetical protein
MRQTTKRSVKPDYTISNRYGVRTASGLACWGTNNPRTAKMMALRWDGKVVDYAAFGRRLEKKGAIIKYTYRKNR